VRAFNGVQARGTCLKHYGSGYEALDLYDPEHPSQGPSVELVLNAFSHDKSRSRLFQCALAFCFERDRFLKNRTVERAPRDGETRSLWNSSCRRAPRGRPVKYSIMGDKPAAYEIIGVLGNTLMVWRANQGQYYGRCLSGDPHLD